MEYFIVVAYGLCLLFIFFFSLGQLHLTLHYLKSRKQKKVNNPLPLPSSRTLVLANDDFSQPSDSFTDKNFPAVTIQLPVYNEKYVVERLLEAIARFDYPQDKLEIQVLDDSTDETVAIIAEKVAELQSQGLNIRHICRPHRKGYKAGALAYGLELARGEFIAIFDADFLPHPDFLLKTIPWFEQEEIGVVQTRWGHINKDYSLLTRLQAFGLDGHFTIEQGGRSHAGSYINFNGTGGVWRKKCIEDAGGWSDDTLTEDLDLSYRAQMRGWRFQYLEEVEAPAELPVLMPAIKSQQFRWNKGAAECARKHFSQIMSNKGKEKSGKNFGIANKLHAFFHLFNSSVFLFLLLAAVLSVPVLFIKKAHPELGPLFYAGGVFLIGFFAIGLFYWISTKQLYPHQSLRYYLKTYPVFLTIMMGLSLHNALAVTEGLLGIKTPFTRTPKFNIKTGRDSWKKNSYISHKISPSTIFEAMLALYFTFGVYLGIQAGDFGLVIFHLMLATGFGFVAFFSVSQIKYGRY